MPASDSQLPLPSPEHYDLKRQLSPNRTATPSMFQTEHSFLSYLFTIREGLYCVLVQIHNHIYSLFVYVYRSGHSELNISTEALQNNAEENDSPYKPIRLLLKEQNSVGKQWKQMGCFGLSCRSGSQPRERLRHVNFTDLNRTAHQERRTWSMDTTETLKSQGWSRRRQQEEQAWCFSKTWQQKSIKLED